MAGPVHAFLLHRPALRGCLAFGFGGGPGGIICTGDTAGADELLDAAAAGAFASATASA